MSELYYCRTWVPETAGSDEQHATRAVAMARGLAIAEVKFILKQAGEDFEQGHLRVTESMDSNLERESVIAEWFAGE